MRITVQSHKTSRNIRCALRHFEYRPYSAARLNLSAKWRTSGSQSLVRGILHTPLVVFDPDGSVIFIALFDCIWHIFIF
ncbi:hypothetical protein CBOM_03534 [Ceraceosorus bombacis]|uniref:Uncharacterized protein n=1 Tax=Ceraceosorus bombacis TaxID=401625 RepID=A0A0P1BHT9_9BASI|nr:hypothetical protein CBOM_03534 [Ceraceosorus bombacis]